VDKPEAEQQKVGLRRELTLVALVATAVCTVIGGGINVLTVEIQEQVPGIGHLAPLAFLLGAVPALFAALAYGVLSSAMPRAGGGYIYISRALHPFIGFIATFSKWFGLSAACGVIAYMDVALLKAAALHGNLEGLAHYLDSSSATLWLPLVMLWLFWLVNLVGIRSYGWTVIVLMSLMLLGGVVVIVYGFLTPPEVGQRLVLESGNWKPTDLPPAQGGLSALLKAVSVLFFAYVGFASISQAGGEARNPSKLLPKAFLLSAAIIAGYYVLFSASVYHAVPWQTIARLVPGTDLSVPEIMGVLMPPGLAIFVALMSALALANDLPPILLAVSRLFYAWAEDGIFPKWLAVLHPRFHTPHRALTVSTIVASLIAIGCNLHGFFQGIDIVVIALCFTYLLIGVSVLTLPKHNPALYAQVAFLRARWAQVTAAILCLASIGFLLYQQVRDDLVNLVDHLAEATSGTSKLMILFESNVVLWVAVMILGAAIFAWKWQSQKRQGLDPAEVFRTLPSDTSPELVAEPRI